MCTAAGRWVRSVSTVRELDRASGPLVVGRCRHACSPTHVHVHASAQLHRPHTDTSALARSRCTWLTREPLLSAHLVSAKGPNCVRAYTRARTRVCECACASDTLPVSQCVRQERCIALRRCVKASENTRSLGLFARLAPSFSAPLFSLSFPLFLSFSLSLSIALPRSSARSSSRPTAPPARFAFPFLRFSHSAERSPPSRPVPPAGDPALRLHRATAREKTSMNSAENVRRASRNK